MHAAVAPTIAAQVEGGYYAGRILIGDRLFGIVVAPKAEGELVDVKWHRNLKDVPAAASYNDGLANTEAMAAAGSPLAVKIRALKIGGLTDWYLGALDENEICYRAFKPTTDQNSLWMRSGINLSADPPTYPYTRDLPAQTENELFRAGGAEAFEPTYYWTSSQYASDSGGAWFQTFDSGGQRYYHKDGDVRARVLRRFAL